MELPEPPQAAEVQRAERQVPLGEVVDLGRSHRVQQFRGVKDDQELEYTVEVHRCVRPTWVTYRVCLHGPTQTRIVCDFDLHVGRYGGRDELRVELSAIGEACGMAANLTTKFPWEIRWRMGYDSDPIDLDWWTP